MFKEKDYKDEFPTRRDFRLHPTPQNWFVKRGIDYCLCKEGKMSENTKLINFVNITIRFPDWLYNKLLEISKAEDRTISNQVRHICSEYFLDKSAKAQAEFNLNQLSRTLRRRKTD